MLLPQLYKAVEHTYVVKYNLNGGALKDSAQNCGQKIIRKYEDVTKKFSDVFAFSSVPLNDNLIYDIKKSSYRKLEILSKIDINTILSLISDDILNNLYGPKDYFDKLCTYITTSAEKNDLITLDCLFMLFNSISFSS